jgi:hypothetical protein
VRAESATDADADARVGVVGDGQGQDDARRKDVRTWEEVCLLCLGGELQSVIAQGKSGLVLMGFLGSHFHFACPQNENTVLTLSTRKGPYPRRVLLA